MKLLISRDVAHKKNDEYECVVVQFEDEDRHYWHSAKNWMPKDDEIYALHKIMYALSPSYRAMIKKELGGDT